MSSRLQQVITVIDLVDSPSPIPEPMTPIFALTPSGHDLDIAFLNEQDMALILAIASNPMLTMQVPMGNIQVQAAHHVISIDLSQDSPVPVIDLTQDTPSPYSAPSTPICWCSEGVLSCPIHSKICWCSEGLLSCPVHSKSS